MLSPVQSRSLTRDPRGSPSGESPDELLGPPFLAPPRPFSEALDDELEALRRSLTQNIATQLQLCDAAVTQFKERLRRLDRDPAPQVPPQDAGIVLSGEDDDDGMEFTHTQGLSAWKHKETPEERHDRLREEKQDRFHRQVSPSSVTTSQRSGRINRGSNFDLGDLEKRVSSYKMGHRLSAENQPGTYLLFTNPHFKSWRSHPLAQIVAKAWDGFMTWEEPRRKSLLAKVLHHPLTQVFVLVIIMANILEVIYHTNLNMEEGTTDVRDTMIMADILFLTFYTVEVLLRLKVHGIHFFVNGEWRWHYFDVFLVVTGVVDFTVSVLIDEASGPDVKFLRVSRFLKVSKVLRTFRLLGWCRELGLVLRLVQSAGITMLSISAVLLAGMVVVSLICVQALTAHIYVDGQNVSPEYVAAATSTFGTVQKGVLTLFKCVTGGTPWEDIYIMLEDSGPLQAAAMIAYILFYQFIVFNIVTSVVVEKARTFSQADSDEHLFHQRQKDENLVDELAIRLFAAAKRLRAINKKKEADEQEFISRDNAPKMQKSVGKGSKVMQEEWQHIVEQPDISDFFSDNSLSVQQAILLYDVLAAHLGSEDGLNIMDLAEGCVKSKGLATSIDLLTVMFEVQALTTMQRHRLGDLDKKLDMLSRVVAAGLSHTSLGSKPHGGEGAVAVRAVRPNGSTASATSSMTAAGFAGGGSTFTTSMLPMREGGDLKSCRSFSEVSSVAGSIAGLPSTPRRADNKQQTRKDPFDRHLEKVQRPPIEV